MTDYSLGDVARILKVSPRRLRYWRKTRLVDAPLDGAALEGDARGDDDGYGFRDLVVLRAIVSMIDRGIPLQRIRRDLEQLRDRLPDLADPASALRIAAGSPQQLALHRDGRWEEAGGQLLFEFADATGAASSSVRPLAPPASFGGGLSASGSAASGSAASAAGAFPGDPFAARDGAHGALDAVGWFERGCELDVESRTWAEAAQAYEQALDLDPDYADAYCHLGAVRYNQGHRAAARLAFEACLERAPHHVEASFNLANVLEEAGEDERALTHYRRALAIDPHYPDLHINLALLYEKLGRMPQAVRHWRRYLQIEPQGSWSTVARQRLARESEQA